MKKIFGQFSNGPKFRGRGKCHLARTSLEVFIQLECHLLLLAVAMVNK